jgi:hypothetical protein
MTREVLKGYTVRDYELPTDWRTRPVLALGPTATALGTSQSTALRLGRKGEIKLLKIATRTMVCVPSLIAYLDRQRDVGFYPTARGNILKAARDRVLAAASK